MTCPLCGYIARLNEIKKHPIKCPGCGQQLEENIWWAPLPVLVALPGSFFLSWELGVRGAWLILGAVLWAYPVWWGAAVALLTFSPPRLRLPRPALHYVAGCQGIPWHRPIALGLSDPPPAPKPEPEPEPGSGAAPPEAQRDQRRA